jgi:hypothetical protein
MKKINLKRPIALPVGDKRILRPGIHNIEDELFSNWFIQGMISTGDIIVIDDAASKPSVLKPSGEKRVVVEVIPKKAEVAKPAEPVESVKPVEPVEEVKPIEPMKPVEPVIVTPVIEEVKPIPKKKKKK